MKLELIGHDHRYAVEQMLLMLLPGESIVYAGDDPDAGTVTLTGSGASARFTWRGTTVTGQIALEELGLDTPDDPKATQQHLVKLAVYRAIIQLTGKPAWGALSGVRPAKLVTKWLRKGARPVQVADLLTGLYGLDRDKAALTIRCAQDSLFADSDLEPRDVCLYVGIPFCPTRCAYCSFISSDVAGSARLVTPYVDALGREIRWAGELLEKKGLRLRAVYFGGGTPTTLSAAQLDGLLTGLDRWLDRSALAEFTVEAGRPDTITADKLAVLRSHGVDRISVNPQTLSDQVLQAMGRAHTAGQFRAAYALAREMDTFSINTDLIAGLPLDTPEGFQATLEEILSLEPQEITVHTLALKNGSALSLGDRPLPDAAAVTEMLRAAHRLLPAHGYKPYYLYRQKYMTGAMENVGWTRRDRGSLYNIVMMEELRSVLALGAGGVTKLIDREGGKILRCPNPKYPREYLDRLEDTMKEREELLWPIN